MTEHQNNPVQEHGEQEYLSVSDLLLEMARVLFLAAIIIIPVRSFLLQPFFVEGSSMEPNFEDGQYLVINEFGYKQTIVGSESGVGFSIHPFREIGRQSIAVFRYPKNPSQFFIKRVIGLPGESIEIRNSKVIIYNAEHPEGFVLDENAYLAKDVVTSDMPKLVLKSDEYFMMGDNRENSYDSRAIGPINKSLIIGKVLMRAWPFSRFDIY